MELMETCTVETAAELRQMLLNALQTGEETVLDFSAVRRIDLTFFQLLSSAQRSFDKSDVPLRLTATLPVELADKAQFTGFDFIVATPGNTGDAL